MAQKNPLEIFAEWYHEAVSKLNEEVASTMCLATADKSGRPSARMVLLKKFNDDGFVFFTNMNSRKGKELAANPHAALCFYWEVLGRQVRIEGGIKKVTDKEADEYFASRHPRSRVGAIVSKQSEILADYKEFMTEVDRLEDAFKGNEIPRPEHWSGFRVIPEMIEFWEADPNRLHKRLVYKKQGNNWKTSVLYP